MAQDCTFFFPQTEGTVWVRKGYDAKGNLQSVMSYQVDEVETLPSGQEVEADYVYTNPSGTKEISRHTARMENFSSTRKRRSLIREWYRK